jgi:hypothetical protein
MSNSNIKQALSKALDFLVSNQQPDGEIPLYYSPDPTMQSNCRYDSIVFSTGLTAYYLSWADDPRARQIIENAKSYLVQEMQPFGMWEWWAQKNHKRAVPDADSTAVCSIALEDHPVIRSGFNRGIFLTQRDKDGRFLVELIRKDGSFQNLDCLVNVNVVWYLGEQPETQPALDYVYRLVLEDSPDIQSLWYYPDKLVTYYAISRAYRHGITRLGQLRDVIIQRTVNRQEDNGCFGDEVLTAHSICLLLNFDYQDRSVIDRALNWLLEQQDARGAWKMICSYLWPNSAWMPDILIHPDAPPHSSIYWGSAEITTAAVIEALARNMLYWQ